MKIVISLIIVIVLTTSCTSGIGSSNTEPERSIKPLVTENVSGSAQPIYEQIKNFDFSVNVCKVNRNIYDEETDSIYKKAFLKILKNASPLKNGDYFYDYLRGKKTDDNTYFNDSIKNLDYQYFDFDEDGFPELIVYSTGLYVFKYLQEENQVYLYYGGSEYSRVLGSGQIYYRMGTSANRLEESFERLDESGNVSHTFHLDTYFELEGIGWREEYWLSIDDAEKVNVDKDTFNEVTMDFYKAIENPLPYLSFEDVFAPTLEQKNQL